MILLFSDLIKEEALQECSIGLFYNAIDDLDLVTDLPSVVNTSAQVAFVRMWVFYLHDSHGLPLLNMPFAFGVKILNNCVLCSLSLGVTGLIGDLYQL